MRPARPRLTVLHWVIPQLPAQMAGLSVHGILPYGTAMNAVLIINMIVKELAILAGLARLVEESMHTATAPQVMYGKTVVVK